MARKEPSMMFLALFTLRPSLRSAARNSTRSPSVQLIQAHMAKPPQDMFAEVLAVVTFLRGTVERWCLRHDPPFEDAPTVGIESSPNLPSRYWASRASASRLVLVLSALLRKPSTR